MEYLCFPEGDPHHKDVSFGFSGPECMLQLFRWAKSLREPSTILFHNGAAYDTLMFLREMRSVLTEDDEMPVPITAGTRIMSLQFGNVVFQDSYLHMNVATAKMPKTYGFRTLHGEEIRKGFCPYRWYDSWEKVVDGDGKLLADGLNLSASPPAFEYFPDNQLADPDFLRWHASYTADNPWDPMEVIAYCKQDVRLQRLAAQRHRRIFYDCTNQEGGGVDVFCGSFPTLASACSRAFLQNTVRFLQGSHVQPGRGPGRCCSQRRGWG